MKSAHTYLSRVAEINLGIICACVPVAFPLAKGVVRSFGSLPSLAKHVFSREHNNSDTSQESRSHIVSSRRWLPKVPEGNMRTLASFFRESNGPRTNMSQSHVMDTHMPDVEMGNFNELQSIDEGYHGYLAEGCQGSKLNLTESTENAQRG